MTSNEAEQFIEQVLKGLWPRWQPHDEEIRGWKARLQHYDYEKSRASLNNLFFSSSTRGIEPPPGKIINALRKARQKQIDKERGCVLFYTLVREHLFNAGKRRGMKFYGKEGCDPAAIENEAENMREKCNALYGCNHIIIRNWET